MTHQFNLIEKFKNFLVLYYTLYSSHTFQAKKHRILDIVLHLVFVLHSPCIRTLFWIESKVAKLYSNILTNKDIIIQSISSSHSLTSKYRPSWSNLVNSWKCSCGGQGLTFFSQAQSLLAEATYTFFHLTFLLKVIDNPIVLPSLFSCR